MPNPGSQNFASEEIQHVGLEEVRFSDGQWNITIGFSRPWDSITTLSPIGLPIYARFYKQLVVDDFSGQVLEMRNREAA